MAAYIVSGTTGRDINQVKAAGRHAAALIALFLAVLGGGVGGGLSAAQTDQPASALAAFERTAASSEDVASARCGLPGDPQEADGAPDDPAGCPPLARPYAAGREGGIFAAAAGRSPRLGGQAAYQARAPPLS